MVEPISGVLVAAAKAAGSEAAKDGGGLLRRALGPTADVIGQALAQYTEQRLINVGRIVGRSEAKSAATGRAGTVNARVAHHVLEDGSYCDDELIAEYLSGVLAASRTPDGRDDRGVAWSATLAAMSALQIRLHYVVYREIAAKARETQGDLALGREQNLVRLTIDINLHGIVRLLSGEEWLERDLNIQADISHAVTGLRRHDLVEHDYASGPVASVSSFQTAPPPFPLAMRLQPSPSGFELYGWAMGDPDIGVSNFAEKAEIFELDPPLDRPDVAFPFW